MMLPLLAALLTGPGNVAVDCDTTAHALAADLDRSSIRWKGTKFWGLGSHEGTVRLRSGEVCVRDGRIVGATFVADMSTIEVADIPADDPVPRRRLRDHLLSEDFFHVAAYPEARLVLTAVEPEQRSLHRVRGLLTIRGQTEMIRFYARVWTVSHDQVNAEARFAVDRHRFGVSYQGSTIEDDLVDDQFWLELAVTARPSPTALSLPERED
jgi:polyisoprenoid-binding protein YceI